MKQQKLLNQVSTDGLNTGRSDVDARNTEKTNVGGTNVDARTVDARTVDEIDRILFGRILFGRILFGRILFDVAIASKISSVLTSKPTSLRSSSIETTIFSSAAPKAILCAALSIVLLGFSGVALSGCTPSSESSPDKPLATEPLPVDPLPAETPSAETAGSDPLPAEVQSDEPKENGLAESGPDADGVAVDSSQLPIAVEASVFQDIAEKNNVLPERLEVEAAVPQSWPDGCLGLGGRDDICTFALVDGWEVTVSGGDRIWVYRTDSDGFVVKEDTEAIAE